MSGGYPKKINLLGLPFTVHLGDEEALSGGLGCCIGDRRQIHLEEAQDPYCGADTFLHEVLHGILYAQGRDNGGKTEEVYVRALASGLLSTLRGNPSFARWLTSPAVLKPKVTND